MRNLLLAVVGVAAAFVVGIVLFNFVVMPRVVQLDVNERVPHLVGLDVSEARRRCAQVGLQLVEEDRRHGAGAEPGRVLSQAPAASTAVKRGRTVRVIVSLGQERVSVPDVRGLSLRQATLQIENARLRLGRVARIHAGGAGPTVRATRPRPGTPVGLGDSVHVLVETGAKSPAFLVPNLVGQDLLDARQLIEARGFRVGRVTYRSARGVYPGTVLQQYPESGSLVHRGDALDLVAATPD